MQNAAIQCESCGVDLAGKEETLCTDCRETIKSFPEASGHWAEACRRIVADCSAARVDGVLVDLFTASAVVQVHDALNETNRAKFRGCSIERAVSLTWRLVGG